MNRAAFALVLKVFRGSKGLSQEELASRSGLHRTFISQLERGLKSPTIDTLFSICAVLDVSASELIRAVEVELKRGNGPTDDR